MIESLSLKYKPTSETELLKFSPGNITIFLGPNNSGKSLLLKEIERWCSTEPFSNGRILADLNIEFPNPQDMIKELKSFSLPLEEGESSEGGRLKYGKLDILHGGMNTYSIKLDDLEKWTKGPDSRVFPRYVELFLLRLDAQTRLNLVNNQETSPNRGAPTNMLSKLLRNNESRAYLSKTLKEVFGRYFTVDPTQITTLCIRLADEEPGSNVEKSFGDEACSFFDEQPSIQEFSDGVKAFTGLLMAVIASSAKILLLDEPEAFLHGSVASKLGCEMSNVMSERQGNLLVATHSPKFLMGCIESGKDVNIVRLTYDDKGGYSRIKMISSDTVRNLMQNPLLRSIGVLDALFYNYVIVTEADADRAFYQEINQRLLSYKSEWGIGDCLFLNVNGKDQIHEVVQPLRNLGIPVAVIADIDLIKNGGKSWKNLLKALFVPETSHSAFENYRKSIVDKFKENDHEMKNGGVTLLSGDSLQSAKDFLGQLQDYGLFLVPSGEIETWLPKLDVPREKRKWLRNIFEKLGSNPSDTDYVKPGEDDVWEFMCKIKDWLIDSKRKGLVN